MSNTISRRKKGYPVDYRSSKIPKGEGKCRSPMEESAFDELDRNPDVVSYIPEPFRIPYEYNGKSSMYKPDILITYRNGSKELAEIKPIHKVDKKRNIAKFTAAKQFSEFHGYRFRIWVRRGVGYLTYGLHTIENKYDNWEDAQKDWTGLLKANEMHWKRETFRKELPTLVFGVLSWSCIIILIIWTLFFKK